MNTMQSVLIAHGYNLCYNTYAIVVWSSLSLRKDGRAYD